MIHSAAYFLEGKMKDTELRKKAVKVRQGALEAIYGAGSGHPGGSLSAADLFTYLYKN